MKKDAFRLTTFLSTAGRGRTIEFVPRNQILVAQGKRGNAVFYILAGAVGLAVASDGEERIISLLGPGNFAGKECLAAVRPQSTSSAKALTNCTVVRIERSEMLHMLRRRQTFATWFRDYLLARVSRYQEVIVDHLVDSSERRLARTLLSLTQFGEVGEAEVIVPNIGQQELAKVVGTTRSRVSFFMNRFRELGFITYKAQGPVTIYPARLSGWLTEH